MLINTQSLLYKFINMEIKCVQLPNTTEEKFNFSKHVVPAHIFGIEN